MNKAIDLVEDPMAKAPGKREKGKREAMISKKASGDCIDLTGAFESASKTLKRKPSGKLMKEEDQVRKKRSTMMPYMFERAYDASEFHEFTVHGNPHVMTDPSYHRGGAAGAGSFHPYNKCGKVW